MKLSVCAIHDKKTGLYDSVFVVRHPGDAIRSWDVVRQNKDTKFGKHPEDFNLFKIAFFDDETGQIEPLNKPDHLAAGI